MHIQGRCHCGAVTYEAEIDPENVAVCHCTDCQRLTGTDYRITVSTPAASFRLLSGEPKLYTKLGDNGRRRLQFFCLECGSPIYTTGEGEAAAEIGIRAGTIDQRRHLPPRRQIWHSSAMPWIGQVAELPGRPED